MQYSRPFLSMGRDGSVNLQRTSTVSNTRSNINYLKICKVKWIASTYLIENPESANEKVLFNIFQNKFFPSFFTKNPFFMNTFLFETTPAGIIMETRLY